jgi:hypothetical protein
MLTRESSVEHVDLPLLCEFLDMKRPGSDSDTLKQSVSKFSSQSVLLIARKVPRVLRVILLIERI